MRRIFIAINLPEDVKKKLQEYQREWADLPVRFVKKGSLHLTILFIGYVDDERMLDVCHKVRKMAKRHGSFELSFNKVCLAPPNRPPRLIWLEGEKSEKLAKLKNEIEKALYGDDSKINFGVQHNEKKELIPHITLARIRQIEWKKLAEKPNIDKEISIKVEVNSIEVMESDLKRDGAEYAILESVELCC